MTSNRTRHKPTVCIIGSLRFRETMIEISSLLAKNGYACHVPVPGKYRDQKHPGNYVEGYGPSVLFSEKVAEEGKCIRGYLEKVRESDVIYVVNPGGYVGFNTVGEIYCAFENKKRVFALERVDDDRRLGIMSFMGGVVNPHDFVSILQTNSS